MVSTSLLFVFGTLALGLPLALGQPFTFTPVEYQPGLSEARQRQEDNYTGFLFDFNGAKTSSQTPNGELQVNQVDTNPFVSTLPNGGNAQTIVTLGPCAGNNPHVHPRGSEISFLLYGNIQFGMVEENAGSNALVIRNMTQNSTIHIPQGLLHFSFNDNCEPAAFLANFGNSDPGVQTIWSSMMQIPTNILNGATGIPEDTINLIKGYPIVTVPGTGGEECLKRCGLNFAQANKLTPLSSLPAANTGATSVAG